MKTRIDEQRKIKENFGLQISSEEEIEILEQGLPKEKKDIDYKQEYQWENTESQKRHEKKPLKKCFRKKCIISHKLTGIFKMNSYKTDWHNLIQEKLSTEKWHFKDKKYGTADEGYISSKMRERCKQFIKNYADCKS